MHQSVPYIICRLSTRYNRRHVALRLAYLGTDYSGFAIQEEPQVTIEVLNFILHESTPLFFFFFFFFFFIMQKCLFDVLKRTKLIEDSRSCNYFRCGRTDTGVSAFAQVRVRFIICSFGHFNSIPLRPKDNP